MECCTVKVKSFSQEQGEFVIINEEDFDATKHVKYEEAKTVEPQIAGQEVKAPKRGRPSKFDN